MKEIQKGVEFICREMEQIYSEGIESGELKKAKTSALSMAAPFCVELCWLWMACRK